MQIILLVFSWKMSDFDMKSSDSDVENDSDEEVSDYYVHLHENIVKYNCKLNMCYQF